VPKTPSLPPDFDAAAARVLKVFEVPGLALAVVKDGRVVVAKGCGLKKLGESALVDSRTLFGIASNTKAFTAAALGLLVDEGKIGWDDPVVSFLPAFQMFDPYVTREMTVRDLLVHRSGLGLGAGDLLWWPPTTYDRKEIFRRLRFIRPATSFRSAYAYDNVLYLVAGELIEAVSGKSWEDFVGDRLLRRVGMTTSSVRFSDAERRGNLSTPHARVEGIVRVVKPFGSDNTNPAGGIVSNAEDMAKWMLVLLNEGRLADGSQLLSKETVREMMTVVTPLPNPDPAPELAALKSNFRGYGLGLSLHDYRGRKVVTHSGALPGYLSKVTLLPELGLGIAVLTNQESAEAFYSLTWHIVDFYLGAPQTDWADAFLKVRARAEARNAEALKKKAGARATSSRPSLALEKYAGTYRDDWYGDIEIMLLNGKLILSFNRTPALVGDLEHWQYDTFLVRWRDRELRADAFLSFALNPDGTIDQAKMRPFSPETDFSFDFQDLLLRPVRQKNN
jgi:CubicO group peptidase (beta-lactamase class C family)